MTINLTLGDFMIEDAPIDGIGATVTTWLRIYGVRSAADFTGGGVDREWNGWGHESVAYLDLTSGECIQVPLLGPKRLEQLLGWRRQVAELLARGGPPLGSAEIADAEAALDRLGTLLKLLDDTELPSSLGTIETATALIAQVSDLHAELVVLRRRVRELTTVLRRLAVEDVWFAAWAPRFLSAVEDQQFDLRWTERSASNWLSAARSAVRAARKDEQRDGH